MNNTKRVYTSGLIAALLATSGLSADGIMDTLVDIGLTPQDVRFSKNESDQLEVTVMTSQALKMLSELEGLPSLDVPENDSRFMKQQSDQTWTGTVTYERVIASLPAGKQPSRAKWTRIVTDLVADTVKHRSMPKTAGKKAGVGKVAETA